jgi:hypothetical protein
MEIHQVVNTEIEMVAKTGIKKVDVSHRQNWNQKG